MSNIEKSGKKPEKKSDKKTKNPMLALVKKISAMTVMVCIITGCIVASFLTVYIMRSMEAEDEISLENVKYNYTTILYAMDNTTGEYAEVHRLHGSENRIWVDYDQIPKHMINAAIAIEDKRFPTHNGVDWKRTITSGINQFVPILPGSPGGSTITQQLIKNITGDDDYRIDRKVREIFRALNLSKNYSREQIMEAYLNTIALGNNTNGVQAAANLYFGKDASELSIAECASIISITQNPSKWNPFRYPESNKTRRESVLLQMEKQGYITNEEYEAALAEELNFKSEENTKRKETTQNWFMDHVMEEVITDLAEEMNYTYAYAEQQLLRGGYRIFTTMDTEIQAYMDKAFIDMNNFPKVYNAEYPEGAFVITDLNGKIVALSGSNRDKLGARLFNRATQALRHPGSIIKPISAYTPSVEKNLITWSTVIEDSPVTINSGGADKQWPRNHYGTYDGPMTVDEAIRRSTNTIPVKLVSMLTPELCFNFLQDKLGLYNLVDYEVINGQTFNDKTLAGMALGGLTHGVTVLEMAGAYQIFGNGGTYTEPYAYTRVEDSEGNIILEKDITPIRVISTETATVMNQLLQRVTTGPRGTGTPSKFSAMPVAGKTGTSDNDYNQWFMGVTPYYVGACWLGYDTQETIRYASYPPPIVWKNIMGPIHSDLPIKQFDVSLNATQATFCTITGNLAASHCETTNIGWYKKSNLPGTCTGHDLTKVETENETENENVDRETFGDDN